MTRPLASLAIIVTFSTLPLLAQPVLNSASILNASGYQNLLAPDTVFVIFGSGMGPASIAIATGPNYPTALGGTSIAFAPSAGGAAIAAKMVYSVAGQVAGLLPSSIAPGTYAVTVTYNSQTSKTQTVNVAARSFGIATVNSGGTGPAQATIGNVNGGISLTRLTTGTLNYEGLTWMLQPAHPGDTLVLWGTGGGADALNDTGGTSGDQTKAGNFMVNVGGTEIVPVYAGTSQGYPGLWQINFTLPMSITPNCFTYVQVSAGGQLGNGVSIPIAPPGQSSCTTPVLSPATLSKLDSGGNITVAQFSVGQTTEGGTFPTSSLAFQGVGGNVAQFTSTEWELTFLGLPVGPCVVTQPSFPPGGKSPQGPDFYLDAGPMFSVSGPGLPAGSVVPVIPLPNGPDYQYNPTAPATITPGGTYTMTAPGGTQVDGFTATATVPTSFSVTNWSSLTSVNRTVPLTVNWTGSGFDQVMITVQSGIYVQSNVTCTVAASLGIFTVPPAALSYLLAGSGQIEVQAVLAASSFTATGLTPGLVAGGKVDFGNWAPFLATVGTITIN